MDEIILNAMEKVESKAPTEPVSEGKPEDKTPASEPPIAGKVEQKSTPEKVWDGDVNKLPPEQQEWAKSVQRHYTQKAMADAELRKAGEEFNKFLTSDDYKVFQDWKNQSKIKDVESQPLVTEDEWVEAQLDASGQKFQNLVAKQVQKAIEGLTKQFGPQLQQIQQTQSVNNLKSILADFTDLHPDIIELNQFGIMKPLFDEELKSGKHQTYESAVQAAYERGSKVRDAIRQEELKRSQARVEEKKGAVTLPGVSTGEVTSVVADNADDALEQAFNFAVQQKKVKVKTKR